MKQIVLHNIRGGFATNSSSSHSLIFVPNLNIGDWESPERNEYQGDYGRFWFVLDTKEGKRDYIAAILYESLSGLGYSERMIEILMRELCNIEYGAGGYGLDHQSIYVLPMDYHHNDHIDVEFFEELRDFIFNKDIAILGGSDEEDRDHDYMHRDGAVEFTYPIMEYRHGDWISRKDQKYGHWTLFNKKEGTRLRLSFVDIPPAVHKEGWHMEMEKHPDKSQYPELVDIKITDWCSSSCEYCYMGSTTKGKHADLRYIQDIAHVLSNMKVFEVALGGGEPTAHPDFVNILRAFRENGIIPNFTTRSLSWLKDEKRRNEILKYAKAFAYSMDGGSDVGVIKEIYDILVSEEIFDGWGMKYIPIVNLHVVMGTLSEEKFKEILREANKRHIRVTLLGFKYTERGASFEVQSYDWWIKAVKELSADHKCPRISVDTIMIQQYGDEIAEAGIPSFLYHKRDGSFSAYIDAVNKTFAPYSYASENLHVKMGDELDYWEDSTMKWFEDIYETF